MEPERFVDLMARITGRPFFECLRLSEVILEHWDMVRESAEQEKENRRKES